ncbi:MAG: 4Fe-4S cluster-binding domain-containing protein [Cetobacterium sp.]
MFRDSFEVKGLSFYEINKVSKTDFTDMCKKYGCDYSNYHEVETSTEGYYFYIAKDKSEIRVCSEHKNDMVNSITGFTHSLFFSGCIHKCDGCFSPQTWSGDNGYLVDIYNLYIELRDNSHKNISMLGGCPFFKEADSLVIPLIVWVKENTKKNIYVWTGYKKEVVEKWIDIALIDYLVDGKFDKNKMSRFLLLRGSENQRVFSKGVDITNTMIKS